MKSTLFKFPKVSYGVAAVCVLETGGLHLYLEIIKVLSEDFMFNEDHDKFTYIKAKNNRNTN